MRRRFRNRFIAGALVAALLTACAGIPVHRANQYATLSSQWDEATRTRLLDQRIQLGDTRAMVYVALGPPLKTPTLTTDHPPREHWEFLAYETDPAFAPSDSRTTIDSSPAQPAIRAQTTNNVVVVSPLAHSRLLVVEFDADGRVADWRLYSDAQDRAVNSTFQPIELPKSPRPSP